MGDYNRLYVSAHSQFYFPIDNLISWLKCWLVYKRLDHLTALVSNFVDVVQMQISAINLAKTIKAQEK